MNSLSKSVKYAFISKITLRNQLAYVADFLIRSLFLLLILYIFLQLWQTTFKGEGTETIAGYSFKQIMWYLVITESMILACPSLCTRVEEEVKSGDIVFKFVRPVNFVVFHYVEYMSEVVVRFMVNAVLGTILGLTIIGPPHFGYGLMWLPLIALCGFTVNFLLNMVLALCAFWVEETRGLEFVYNKFLFTIGGMLMPLEIFPDVLQRIGHWLPFQAIVYLPAKTTVAFDMSNLAGVLATQLIWMLVIGIFVSLVYRKGVKKLNVNGG
ncbi:ABC transporter permease [Paenibacillus aceris]|uniref:ABC-2 type transport system permease protein n=1 Tax=Paenibacillus aceris TaxID=869555 RepID=A0ABS4HR30_9BACL|nr:ABC-2 family transporter protein [Paenibacillus aceris]MBP1961005.1 ABC-2 type transport system permease protein [Paenibacillus aceris]NHW35329.1 ABC transporter permease [Paenibacillus aceris]